MLLFESNLLMQLFWIQFTGMIIIGYVLRFKPFEGSLKNQAVVIEELAIELLIYIILCFSDWVPDLEVRQMLGIFFIAVTVGILLIFHLINVLILC